MRFIAIGLAFAGLLMSACAPSPTRPGVVFDQAKDEVRQAVSDRKGADADEAALPPLSIEMPKNVETEPRFDLSVVSAPASQVFMALVTGTRYNMLVTPEVSGQITISLKDVTVKEALEAIRDLYGYEFAIKGNRIKIEPNTIQTRVFHVNYLAMRRQGGSELRVNSGAGTATPSTGTTGTTGTTTTGTTGTTGTTTTGTTSDTSGNGTTTGQTGATSRVRTQTYHDFWTGLTTALTAIVGSDAGRSVVVNPASGILVVRALPSELRSVDTYLKATQVVVDRQVILEAKIIDVTLSQDYQAGVNWAAFRSTANGRTAAGVSGATTNLTTTAVDTRAAQAMATVGSSSTISTSGVISPGSAGTSVVTPGQFGSVVAQTLGKGFFGLAFQTANFAALLNFLETQGSVSVLSSPRIATLNNQKAVLKVGTDDLFVTNVTTTTTSTSSGSVSTPSLTLQSYFSGISLDVTPQIDEDNNIILHIHPSVSVVTEKIKTVDLGAALGTFTLPLASSSVNETDSIIRARDGSIVAIGGLMRQEQDVTSSGLPGSGKMGAAGTLLGQRGNTLSKRELVILLKPTVIADDRDWANDIDRSSARLRELDPASQFSDGTR